MQEITADLLAISNERRPVWKIAMGNFENLLGHWILRRLPPGQHRWLNLGCGTTRFDGFVNADCYRISDMLRPNRMIADWMLDASRPWKCPDNYWQGIFTEHTLEHLDYNAVISCLKECLRTLKPDGTLRIVLPGLAKSIDAKPETYTALTVGQLTQSHGHISVWDADLLGALLREIGFTEVTEHQFGKGAVEKLVLDLDSRRGSSFYIEAKAPK